ncbi:hypothetical protein [Pseudosulfitobacter sp. SM2401]|uniref:hypothetical protein n=1 Tax=Pseudosulfitobacter sp. SM2401 TaxID=3350098 RepID=UPI0036F34A33
MTIWKTISGICILFLAALTFIYINLNSEYEALSKANAKQVFENNTLSSENSMLATELAAEKVKFAAVSKKLEYANSQAGYDILLETCFTSINGKTTRLNYDIDNSPDEQTFRDALFGGKGEIDCPAHVTLRNLTQELSDTERGVFCLNYDQERTTYTGISHGERDAYLVCKSSKTFCERVNVAKDEVLAFAALGGAAATASASATAVASAAGVTAVTHSSGAVIITGTSGYIAGTLGPSGRVHWLF